MTKTWEAGLHYPFGSVVEFQGQSYRIIQPHTSQSDWAPTVTPALWRRIDNPSYHSAPQAVLPPNAARLQFPVVPQGSLPPPPNANGYGAEYVHPHYGSPALPVFPSPNTRSTSQASLAARAPPPVPPQHTRPSTQGPTIRGNPDIDSRTREVHPASHEDWVTVARQRMESFQRDGPKAPTTWVLTEGHTQVSGALVAGYSHEGRPLNIRREYRGGNIIIRSEPTSGLHEILLGDTRGVQWIQHRGPFNPGALDVHAVSGAASGRAVYIARAVHHGNLCVGSCAPELNGALLDGGELVPSYEVLCYNK